jgi:hypothetical protein
MTEVEWLACTDPLKMLHVIGATPRFWRQVCEETGRRPSRTLHTPSHEPSDRKLRLLACHCELHGRGILGMTEDLQDAAVLARRFADGELSEDQWHLARAQAGGWLVLLLESKQAAYHTIASIVGTAAQTDADTAAQVSAVLSDLIRELIGPLPFRPVAIDPRWQSPDVLGLARGIYQDQAFERLPILADALLDAGCDNDDLLGHCRAEGGHVRGCWVVDLVLGLP